jgi:hypothetical protein
MLFRSSTLRAGLLLVSLPVALATPHLDEHGHGASIPPRGNNDGQFGEVPVGSGARDHHQHDVVKYDVIYSNGQGQPQGQDDGRGQIQTINAGSGDTPHPNDLTRSMGVFVSNFWNGNMNALDKSQRSDADVDRPDSDNGRGQQAPGGDGRKIVAHQQPEDHGHKENEHLSKRENTGRGPEDFHMNQVRNADFVPANGLQQMLKAYNKFGKALPERLKKAIRENPKAAEQAWAKGNLQARDNTEIEARAVPVVRQKAKKKMRKSKPVQRFTQAPSGSVPAIQPMGIDFEYNCPVKIGTPPQIMNLNLDTGSADL